MSDRDRSDPIDSPPAEENDTRSDIEQAVESRSDDVEHAGTKAGQTSALDDAPANAGGAGGIVKNQNDDAQ